MKKVFLAAMISLGLCVLCACGKGKTGIRGEEVAQINCETDFKNYVVSGKDGYYLFCNGLIARWDGDVNHTAVPLCSRPNCSHDSEACFSFVQTLEKKIFYIDENIYIFGYPNISSVTKEAKCPLWKISADGSGKEIVLYASDWPSIYTIFQDDVYYGLQKEDENGKSVCCVARQPLSGGEETLVWTSDLQAGSFTILQGIGDRLYLQECGVDRSMDMDDPDLDFDQLDWKYNLYTYQPGTDQWEKNPIVNENGSVLTINNVFAGRLYYSLGKGETENQLYSIPVDGNGEAAALGKLPKYACKTDTEYVYTYWRRDLENGTSGVKVYDYDRNLKQEIQMAQMDDNLEWIPATEQYVFGYYETGQVNENGQAECAVVLLEREKFADGTAEMIPLIRR